MFSLRRSLISAFSALTLSACAGAVDLPIARAVLTTSPETNSTALKPGKYVLDPAHAYLHFSLNHMQMSELRGRFDIFSVALEIPDEDVSAASLTADVDVNSLFLASTEFSQTLKGEDWFDTATYPEARFVVGEVTMTGEAMGLMTGELTLRGETHPVTMDVVFNGGADVMLTGLYTIGFTASGQLSRSNFGLGQYAAFVSDTVTINFSGEFHRVE